VAEKWRVKIKDGDIYEYDGYARTISGALWIFMDSGDRMVWGPHAWDWAKHDKEKPSPSEPQ
jgi:hypothetical protein